MATKIIDIKCPNCGAGVDTSQKVCAYCRQPVIISTFNSVFEMPMPVLNQYASAYRKTLAEEPENRELNSSLAMCYLKLGLHDEALSAFQKAIEDNIDNPETFLYAAICLLKGKKAFQATRPAIDKIEAYLRSAMMLEPTNGLLYYFQAYIKYDYFSRKSYNTSPTYQEALAQAVQYGVSPHDAQQLFLTLGVSCPTPLVLY